MGWLIGTYRHPLSPIASFSPVDILTTPREYQLPGPLAQRLRGTPAASSHLTYPEINYDVPLQVWD